MKSRPWPIVILGILHCIAPITNILWACILQKTNPIVYFSTFFQQASSQDYIELFILFPLAGICVYLVKAWSYAFYNGIMAYSFYQNYLNWNSNPDQYPLALLLAFYFVNTGCVSYFLIPEVRKTYFDKKHRWWESKPRYYVQLMGSLFSPKGHVPCRILNISEGGAFIECTALLEMNDPIQIEFSLLQIKFPCMGNVVHIRNNGKRIHGYGLKLKNPDTVKHLIEALKILKVSSRDDNYSLWHDFVDWIKTASTSVEAWIPQIDSSPPTAQEENPLPSTKIDATSHEHSAPENRIESNVVQMMDFADSNKKIINASRPQHWPNGLPKMSSSSKKAA